jgi:hypothetical protein
MNIQLTNGQVALIDEGDLFTLSKFDWLSVSAGKGLIYAYTQINNKTVYMHRLIMGEPLGLYVDHRNRNGLDNQRENLRITTQSVNIANAGMFENNTSGYKGVVKYRKGWKAQIKFHQKTIQSNMLNSKMDAAILRDELVRQLFNSEKVWLNLPETCNLEWAMREAARLIQNQLK